MTQTTETSHRQDVIDRIIARIQRDTGVESHVPCVPCFGGPRPLPGPHGNGAVK
jgi:hypothetical protein